MSKLSIENPQGTLLENHQVEPASTSWRADLAKVDVWYASFGSNMWKPRFLCYIQGGQVSNLFCFVFGVESGLWSNLTHLWLFVFIFRSMD